MTPIPKIVGVVSLILLTSIVGIISYNVNRQRNVYRGRAATVSITPGNPTGGVSPTVAPTIKPTITPTKEPTKAPTTAPTVAPTVKPTIEPTVKPTPSQGGAITCAVMDTKGTVNWTWRVEDPGVIDYYTFIVSDSRSRKIFEKTATNYTTQTLPLTEEIPHTGTVSTGTLPGVGFNPPGSATCTPDIVGVAPTITPTVKPTVVPTVKPTIEPTVKPTIAPTVKPTIEPTKPQPTPTVKPLSTPNLSCTQTAEGIKWSWSAVPEAVSYWLQVWPNKDTESWSFNNWVGSAVTSVTAGKTPNMTYLGHVLAGDGVSMSNWSETKSCIMSFSEEPTPTVKPTVVPTVKPTIEPTIKPTVAPTLAPTVAPTVKPTIKPTKPQPTPTTIEPTVPTTPTSITINASVNLPDVLNTEVNGVVVKLKDAGGAEKGKTTITLRQSAGSIYEGKAVFNDITNGSYYIYIKAVTTISTTTTNLINLKLGDNINASLGTLLSGDANGDDRINMSDLVLWEGRNNADFNLNRLIDDIDLSIWAKNYR